MELWASFTNMEIPSKTGTYSFNCSEQSNENKHTKIRAQFEQTQFGPHTLITAVRFRCFPDNFSTGDFDHQRTWDQIQEGYIEKKRE